MKRSGRGMPAGFRRMERSGRGMVRQTRRTKLARRGTGGEWLGSLRSRVVRSPVAGPARWFLDFEGTFVTEQTSDGTVVTHREVFKFKRPWRWLAEPLLRRWLENDTAEEMVRFKKLVERDTDAPASER